MSVLCAAGGHLRSVANELCSKNKQKKRTPTKEEISKGVLPHLLVQEVSRKHSTVLTSTIGHKMVTIPFYFTTKT